jgi:hypothetical protein
LRANARERNRDLIVRLHGSDRCIVTLCHARRSVPTTGVPHMEHLEKIVAAQQFAMH